MSRSDRYMHIMHIYMVSCPGSSSTGQYYFSLFCGSRYQLLNFLQDVSDYVRSMHKAELVDICSPCILALHDRSFSSYIHARSIC